MLSVHAHTFILPADASFRGRFLAYISPRCVIMSDIVIDLAVLARRFIGNYGRRRRPLFAYVNIGIRYAQEGRA